jgi:hypothetical protein
VRLVGALVAGLLFATSAAAQMIPSLPGVPATSVGPPAMIAPSPVIGAPTRAVGPLPVTGPAQGALRQLNPPTPLEQVIEHSMRRLPPLPPVPAQAAERWVPERRVYAPEYGRDVVVPGHYEGRISDQPYGIPPLSVLDVPSGRLILVPGSGRPPVDQREGP